MSSQSVRKSGSGGRGGVNFSMILGVSLAVLAVILSVDSAVPRKRSIVNASGPNELQTCWSEGICGWEVYQRSTRITQYYVTSSCKCSTERTCVRAEDDVAGFYYVYRCRILNRRNHNRHRGSSSSENSVSNGNGNSTTTTTAAGAAAEASTL